MEVALSTMIYVLSSAEAVGSTTDLFCFLSLEFLPLGKSQDTKCNVHDRLKLKSDSSEENKMPHWYSEKKELRLTPSQVKGLTHDTEMRYRREGARWARKTDNSTYMRDIVIFGHLSFPST